MSFYRFSSHRFGFFNMALARVLGCVGCALILATSSAGAQVITEFSAGISPSSNPQGIAAGPDGNVWFTERFGDRIGRITPAGLITEFSAGITAGAQPADIVLGIDGNLWFTEASGNRIGRITIGGTVTEFPIPSPAGSPFGIALGADGNIWFTAVTNTGGAIGRILTSIPNTITIFHTGISDGIVPYSITPGPDGRLWFTEQHTAKIGVITTSGTVTEFPSASRRVTAWASSPRVPTGISGLRLLKTAPLRALRPMAS